MGWKRESAWFGCARAECMASQSRKESVWSEIDVGAPALCMGAGVTAPGGDQRTP